MSEQRASGGEAEGTAAAAERLATYERYQRALRRPWAIMTAAGMIAIGLYIWKVLKLAPHDGRHGMFSNPRFLGLVVATFVSIVAGSRAIRSKWPAAVALVAMLPLWRALAAQSGPWVRSTSDAVIVGALALLPVTALVTLVLPRPRLPAVRHGLPEARVTRGG